MKDVIHKMLDFFESERRSGKPWNINNPLKRLARASGLSETSIKSYAQREDPVQAVVKSVHEDAVRKSVPVAKKLDDFDEALVRRTIHGMYEKKELVTMPKLHAALKEKDIDVSLSTIVRTVKKLGFRYEKKGSNRRFVSERQDIVSWRHTFLRKVRKLRQEGRNIVYLDEPWLNTNHVVKGDWLDGPSTSMSVFEPQRKGNGRVLPSGKGTRLIILDAGSSQQGLIPGCGLIFESKLNTSDYHDEMNSTHFTEWFKDKLIPQLPPRSVVVMDNAPYHSHLVPDSKVPNTGSRKSVISAWLDKNNVHYDKEMVKAELLELVKQNRPRPRYVIDELAAASGHEVLRLPPHHCELNPIEMVWSDLKGFVGRRNSTYKKKDIIKLFEEAKSRFDAERWARFENHVVNEVEEKLWRIDGIRDDEDNSTVLIDLTDNDSDIDDMFDEAVASDVDDDDEAVAPDVDSDAVSDTIDESAGDNCKVCNAYNPPGLKKGEKHFSWLRCDLCDLWVHYKCCKKAALKKKLCNRCHAILTRRDLSRPLFLPMEGPEH